MWPITYDTPKPLLPVGGRPAIDYVIDKLLEIDVTEIFLTTNLKFEKQFRTWLAERPDAKTEIVTEPSRSESEKLGAVRALGELVHHLPRDDYVIVAGDNIFADSLEAMVAFYRQVRRSVVAIFEAENLSQVRRGSTVSLDQNARILSFEEKPKRPAGRLLGACLYILPFTSLRKAVTYLDHGGGGDDPGNFIAWLCRKEVVYGFRLEKPVWDIGSIEEYERTQRTFGKRQPT